MELYLLPLSMGYCRMQQWKSFLESATFKKISHTAEKQLFCRPAPVFGDPGECNFLRFPNDANHELAMMSMMVVAATKSGRRQRPLRPSRGVICRKNKGAPGDALTNREFSKWLRQRNGHS